MSEKLTPPENPQVKKIDIEVYPGDRIKLTFSPTVTWTIFIRAILATIRQFAKYTVETARKHFLQENPDLEFYEAVAYGDIADQINIGITNILNEISPRDPDLQLTEVALLYAENTIINDAAKRGITLKQALKEYEKIAYDSLPENTRKRLADAGKMPEVQ